MVISSVDGHKHTNELKQRPKIHMKITLLKLNYRCFRKGGKNRCGHVTHTCPFIMSLRMAAVTGYSGGFSVV